MINTYKKGVIDGNDLRYAQERIGREIIGAIPAPISIYESGEHKGKEKINPHVTRFELKQTLLDKIRGRKRFADLLHVKPIYYLDVNGEWRPLTQVTTYLGNKRIDLIPEWDRYIDLRYLNWLLKRMELIGGTINIPSPYQNKEEVVPLRRGIKMSTREAAILFATDTFYPDANTETTSVDGYLGTSVSAQSWATAHDRTSATDVNDSGTTAVDICDAEAGGGYRIFRMVYLFDTSSLTSGATISAATFSINYDGVSGAGHNDTGQSLGLVQSSPASNTALASGDIDGFTLHSDTLGASALSVGSYPSAGSYADFSMNATGLSWIAKTGVTKLGCRRSPDYNDTVSHTLAPSGVTQSHRNWRTADYTGTSSDPKLVVTYTVGTNYTKDLTETIVASDSIVKQTGKTINATIVAVATMLRDTSKSFAENVVLVDTANVAQIFTRAFTDTIVVADSITRQAGKLVTDTVVAVDSAARSLARTLTDTVVAVDTVTNTVVYVKDFVENITLSVTSTAKITAKILTENVVVVDTVATLSTFAKALTETVVVTAASARSIGKALTDNITLSVTLSNIVAYGIQLYETIVVKTRLRGLLNGLNMLLNNKYTAKAGSYVAKYSNKAGSYFNKYLDQK